MRFYSKVCMHFISSWCAFQFQFFPAPVSNNARHLTPFTSTVTIGYTTPFLSTLVVVISWSHDVGLSQIDVRCLRPQIWQPERHLHSEARCRLPVQLKHSCFRPNCFLRSPTVMNLLQFTALWLVATVVS